MADVSSIDWLKVKRDYLSDTDANLRIIITLFKVQ